MNAHVPKLSEPLERPTLTAAQEALVLEAASHRVVAAVQSRHGESSRKLLAAAADTPVYGAFVTLKRAGRLRSCCGCLGDGLRLADALDGAADRAATDDPRFPPISAEELPDIDMHVWLLWGPQVVAERGEERVNAVTIGKHGLQVIRAGARGLLLPSVAIDYKLDARGFLQQVCLKAGLPKDTWLDDDTTLLVFEGFQIEGRLQLEAADVRLPAVAGSFYPGTPQEIQRSLDAMFPTADAAQEVWAGALVPHAGWAYSGRLAAAVLQRLEIPDRVVILCPKHRPGGAPWAIAPHSRWLFPGGELASDRELAIRLAHAIDGTQLDAAAHRQEHAIEVQLPLLARLAPHVRVVGIVVGERPLPELLQFGRQLADTVCDMPQPPLLLVSSDMHHFATEAETLQLDQLALDAIQTLDPTLVFETVKQHQISMCGMAPCVVAMEALRCQNLLGACEIVGHTTSAETTKNTKQVVGYAGLLFR